MKTTGIIAEYNPFHNGHLYQMQRARKLTGCDFLIIVMSPDFVQRGEPALLDKWARARMALLGGADLVLELPVRYAAASAEFFAKGAVELLDCLGVVDALSFGCESDRMEPLMEYARFLSEEEPESVSFYLQEKLRQGVSYAEARCLAYLEYRREEKGSQAGEALRFEEENTLRKALSSPNNILAVEYLKAILRSRSRMQPYPVPRTGCGYHDLMIAGKSDALSERVSPSSAAGIRAALSEGIDVRDQMPDASYELLSEELSEGRFLTCADLDLALRLSLHEKQAFLADYADVNGELANRIRHLLPEYTGFDQFCALLKTKQIAYTRVRRALLHILLGLGKKEKQKVSYARVLGFRRSAKPLLSDIKRKASIPLVTRLPSEDSFPELMREDLNATNLWELLVSQKTGAILRCERQRRLIIL